MHDLTRFQRDVLRRLAAMGGTAERGLALKEQLEERDGYPHVNHGRLYPNLDRLVEMGLVGKTQEDGRTNSYRLTRRGRRLVREQIDAWLEADRGLNFDRERQRAKAAIASERARKDRPEAEAAEVPDGGD